MEFYSDFHIVGKVIFFEKGRFVKKSRKATRMDKPYKNRLLAQFESAENRRTFILRKVL